MTNWINKPRKNRIKSASIARKKHGTHNNSDYFSAQQPERLLTHINSPARFEQLRDYPAGRAGYEDPGLSRSAVGMDRAAPQEAAQGAGGNEAYSNNLRFLDRRQSEATNMKGSLPSNQDLSQFTKPSNRSTINFSEILKCKIQETRSTLDPRRQSMIDQQRGLMPIEPETLILNTEGNY